MIGEKKDKMGRETFVFTMYTQCLYPWKMELCRHGKDNDEPFFRHPLFSTQLSLCDEPLERRPPPCTYNTRGQPHDALSCRIGGVAAESQGCVPRLWTGNVTTLRGVSLSKRNAPTDTWKWPLALASASLTAWEATFFAAASSSLCLVSTAASRAWAYSRAFVLSVSLASNPFTRHKAFPREASCSKICQVKTRQLCKIWVIKAPGCLLLASSAAAQNSTHSVPSAKNFFMMGCKGKGAQVRIAC
jgi:hypothetical protein